MAKAKILKVRASKSKKVAAVEESETSVAQEHQHQPEPEYSADIATLFAIEMEKAAPAAISQGAAKAKAKTDVKAMPKKPGTGKGRCGIAAVGIAVMNQAIQETMQSNREQYEKKSKSSQKAIEEAEAQGKAANEAILERQAEMKQLREQYAEERSQDFAEEANLQPRRFGAGGVAKALSRFGIRHGFTFGQEEREESPACRATLVATMRPATLRSSTTMRSLVPRVLVDFKLRMMKSREGPEASRQKACKGRKG